MYRQILVPLDGSETANKALAAALQLAKESGGRLRMVHVIEAWAYISGYEQVGAYAQDLLDVLREAGKKVLQDAMRQAKAAGVAADSMLFYGSSGRLAEVVATAAREWKADPVVVGTHGRRSAGRMLLGSGAEQIIGLAPVPVLVIRSATNHGTELP